MARIRVKISYTSTIYLVACAKAFRYLKKVFRKGKYNVKVAILFIATHTG